MPCKLLIVSVPCLFASLVVSAQAADLLVPADFSTIQGAINSAVAGDRVVVAPGTYSGTGNRDLNPLGKSITILGEMGAAQTIIDCGGSAAEPHRGFDIISGGSALTIDGFTIINGYQTTGGAIQMFGLAAPTIQNCVFDNCTATNKGGGVYVFGLGSPTFTSCTFSNSSANFGGGMHSSGTSSPVLTNCSFNGNSASGDGGGYDTTGGTPVLGGCTFTSNTAVLQGGGLHAQGDADPAMANCIFLQNAAEFRGGGAAFVACGGKGSVTSCDFTGNSAGTGGGISCLNGSSPTVIDTTISENVASLDAGGVDVHGVGSVPVFDNCTFSGNRATGLGGGMRAAADAVPVLTSVTMSNITAGWGGGLPSGWARL